MLSMQIKATPAPGFSPGLVLQLTQCSCALKYLCHLSASHRIIKCGCTKGCTGQCRCLKANMDVGGWERTAWKFALSR